MPRYIVTVVESHTYTYSVRASDFDDAEEQADELHAENKNGPDNAVPDLEFTARLATGSDEEE